MSARAVCVRCGTSRGAWDQICPHCGHRPLGDGLLIAWLLSSEALGPAELDAAAERIRAGESVSPTDAMLKRARNALGRSLESDPGLTGTQRLGLLLTSVLLTPLPGLVMWAWWRERHPRAALQALAMSLPVSLFLFFAVLWTRFA